MNAFDEFLFALEASGLTPFDRDHIKADGTLCRYRVHGDKPGSLNGWCVYHAGARPTGAFGSWKAGNTITWHSRSNGTTDPVAMARLREQIRQQREARMRELSDTHAKAREVAQTSWAAAEPASAHPYLARKQLPGLGLRQLADALLVPLLDETGTLHSVQTIKPDGKKLLLKGGRKSGMFCPVGLAFDSYPNNILIAEGWATACAAHLIFKLPAVSAIDTGNLQHAGTTLRRRWPNVVLTFTADRDLPDGGIGLAKAKEAAQKLGNAKVLAPIGKPGTARDFADEWLDHNGVRQ